MPSAIYQQIGSNILTDERNRRLVVNSYPEGTEPRELAASLIATACQNGLSKIWLWALPADVPDFLSSGFQLEGHLFQGKYNENVVSLACFLETERARSAKLSMEDEVLNVVTSLPLVSRTYMLQGVTLGILNHTHAAQVSQLLTQVFSSYPSPVENPQYICSLMQNGCIFAGALYRGKLISVVAAYLDLTFVRCEMTDCATLEEYRGYSLTEKLLRMLMKEIKKRGSYTLFTLARAQSTAMNRVFFKLGYKYRGRLINNCHISGSYQDMNLWIN